MYKAGTGILLAAVLIGCNSERSPTDTIDALVDAVRSRDSIEVARYIDIARVAESAVDPLYQAATIMEQNDPDAFRAQTGGMGVEALRQFRPMLAPLMENLFWQMMLHPEELEQGILAPIIGERSLPFEQIGENYQGVVSERNDGEDVIASVRLANEAANHEVTIDMRLERGEDGWKVVSFENLAEAVTNVMGSGD